MDYSSSGKMLVSVKKQRRSIVLTPALIASANNPMCDAAQNSIVRNNLRRQTLSRMFEAVDSGLLTSDVKRGFLEFASTTDLSYVTGARQLKTLCGHAVQVPAFSGEGAQQLPPSTVGSVCPVHSLLMAESSSFFDALIKYSRNSNLQLPYGECGFLKQEINEILNAMINGEDAIAVREDNCVDLYQAADYLLYQDLRVKTLDYIKEQCTRNLSLALDIWAFSEVYYLPELNGLAFDQIIRSFPRAIQESLWPQLEFDMVHRLLSHPGINCSSELAVLDAALRWLDVDWPKRSAHGESLLSCVRLGLMNTRELGVLMQHEMLSRFPSLLALLKSFPNVPPNLLDVYRRNSDNLAFASTPREPHEAVMLFGGWCQEFGPRAACQVFNPRANTWTMWSPNASRPSNDIGQVERRVYSGCLVVNDVLHLIGGFDGERALNTVSCYNLKTQAGWYEGSCMIYKRYYVCCASIGSQMFAIGGHSGETQDRCGGRLDSVEKTSVDDNSWLPVASMRTVRSDAGAAALNGRIYVAGGFNGQQYHDTAEVYDPATDQWSFISRMNFCRGGVSLVAMGNTLYAIGGNDGQSRLAVVEAYQHESEGWVFSGRLRRQKSNLSTAVLEGGIMVMGGWSDQPTVGILSTVEKFNPTADGATEQLADLSYAASATSACTIAGRELIKRYLGNQLLRASNPWHVAASPAAAGEAAAPEEINSEPEGSTDTHFIQSSQDADLLS
uniref:BACK domain-containing protein n=1 Tax=Macrostomum lignano TaxID=282301 RepID=A0A1I8J5H7_9PLAT